MLLLKWLLLLFLSSPCYLLFFFVAHLPSGSVRKMARIMLKNQSWFDVIYFQRQVAVAGCRFFSCWSSAFTVMRIWRVFLSFFVGYFFVVLWQPRCERTAINLAWCVCPAQSPLCPICCWKTDEAGPGKKKYTANFTRFGARPSHLPPSPPLFVLFPPLCRL